LFLENNKFGKKNKMEPEISPIFFSLKKEEFQQNNAGCLCQKGHMDVILPLQNL